MTISVIVPCFNEEESIPLFHEAMEAVNTKSVTSLNIFCQ